MADRFDLSWKNKEVRVWVYVVIPIIILIACASLFTSNHFYLTIFQALGMILTLISYRAWQLYYRKRQKNVESL